MQSEDCNQGYTTPRPLKASHFSSLQTVYLFILTDSEFAQDQPSRFAQCASNIKRARGLGSFAISDPKGRLHG